MSQARAYNMHPRAELAAVCDVDEERLAAASRELGVERTYTDYRCMLDEVSPDIVNIPTRTDLHAPLTIGVLEHKAPKAVVVEKPMANSLGDADRMVELAAKNGTRLAVHHQMRTTPPFNVAERLISDGAIGPLTSFKLRGKGYYGGYDMVNIGTHLLNGTRRFSGEARSVTAMLTTGGRPTTGEDVIAGPYGFGWTAGENISPIYGFESGLVAFAEFHRRSQPDNGWVHMKIYGEDGALCLHNQQRLLIRRTRDWDVAAAQWEPYELPAEDRYLHGYDYFEHAGGDLWMAEETIRALDEDRPHQCSGEDGRGVMDMMYGAWESHFTGRRVDLPMPRGYHPLLKARSDAGLGDPDDTNGMLGYRDWLPKEFERIGVAT
jgi:predicted dehydrogenase